MSPGFHLDLARGRRLLLVHLAELDDVERPGLRPPPRRDDRPLRRQPDEPSPMLCGGSSPTSASPCFGTSPGYLEASQRADLEPGRDLDLSALRLIGVTGSVLPAARQRRGSASTSARSVQVGSMSGGTDIVGHLRRQRTDDPGLATARSARRHSGWRLRVLGRRRTNRSPRARPGELVITGPDAVDAAALLGRRRRQRLYDDVLRRAFPGVWRQGDLDRCITDRGTVVIHGRSDSTLNRHGVRVGSAEIYEAVASPCRRSADALVVGVEQPDGGYWMPVVRRAA